MANYTWPDTAIPSNFSLSRFTKTFRGSSMFGRSGQNVDTANDRWKISMSLSARDLDTGAALEAFLNKLRQGVNTVSLYHYERPVPNGTVSLTASMYSDVDIGASILPLQVSAYETLLSGDMFEVDGLLFQCAFDCEADSAGLLYVPIVGFSRKALLAGAFVNFDKASGTFNMSNLASTTYGPQGYIMSMSLDFVEKV